MLGAEHGSPVSRAERKLIKASTVEPDLDHASAGRTILNIPCHFLSRKGTKSDQYNQFPFGRVFDAALHSGT